MRNLFSMVLIWGAAAFLVFGILEVNAQTNNDPLKSVKDKAAQLNQVPSLNNAQEVIGRGIEILMMFMGAIMFALVVYGGGLWMTASGNNEKISKAKNIIIWAALGVVVMLASYVVINFVFDQLAGT